MLPLAVKPDDNGAGIDPPNLSVYWARPEAGGDEPTYKEPDVVDRWLVPETIKWGMNGEPSTVTLTRQLGIGDGRDTHEHPDPKWMNEGVGYRVRVTEWTVKDGNAVETELFRGTCGQIESLIQSQPDRELVRVTAYGPEQRLQHRAITGAWYANTTADDKLIAGTFAFADAQRDNTIQTYLPATFNPKGQPNASSGIAWNLTTKAAGLLDPQSRVFVAPGRTVNNGTANVVTSVAWTAWRALRSTLQMFDDTEVISYFFTDWAAIKALLSDGNGTEYPIANVNITGMNLLEAMRAILLPIGYGFCLDPWVSPDGKHSLHVFSLKSPTTIKRPPMAKITAEGDNVDITGAAGQRAQVQRLHFLRDDHNVCNDILVVGDRLRVTAALTFHADSGTRDLHPAWDTTLAANALDTYDDGSNVIGLMQGADEGSWTGPATFQSRFLSPLTSATFHVYRTFVWNEDGSWNHVVSGIPDLSSYGADTTADSAIRRPRPLGPTCLTTDAYNATGYQPAYVEMGINGDDDSWVRVPAGKVNILKSCAGFRLTGDVWNWQPFKKCGNAHAEKTYGEHTYLTLLHRAIENMASPTLTFRLVGGIECDEVVTGSAPRQKQSAWPFKSTKILYRPDRFKYRGAYYDPDSARDDRSDAALATAYAGRVRDALEDAMGHGSLMLRGIHRGYRPGDGIDRTADRDVRFVVDGRAGGAPERVIPIVAGVTWQFTEGTNKTEITLASSLMRLTV